MLYSAIAEDLPSFCVYDWPGFQLGGGGSHIRKTLSTLSSIQPGMGRRVIMSFPPRHYKTSMIQRWIAWALGNDPDRRFMYLTYGAELAEPKSGEIRAMVESPWYQNVFPDACVDPNARSLGFWRMLGRRGYVLATGVGGRIGGMGATDLVIDDPFKDREEADSELIRQKILDWYSAVAYTRLEPNPPSGNVVVVHTRWHEADLIGSLLAAMDADPMADKWEVLDFPAIGPDQKPLWFPLDVYLKIKANINPRDWAALYQGKPVPDEGAMFREEDFIFVDWDEVPQFDFVFRYWDLALTIKQDGDFTAGALIGIDSEGRIWILDVIRIKSEWPEVRQAILARAGDDADGKYVVTGVEDVAHQGAAIQELRRQDIFRVKPFVPSAPKGPKDSKYRAAAWAARAREGKLRIVRGAWNKDFIHECLFFPYGAHDDMVDAVSGAVGLCLFRSDAQHGKTEDRPKPGTEQFEKWIRSEAYYEWLERQSRERYESAQQPHAFSRGHRGPFDSSTIDPGVFD